MTYRSCESFIVNQAGVALQDCRTDWVCFNCIVRWLGYWANVVLQASILDNLAFNCQATQNAHGGLSVATDQRWFIQYVYRLVS